MILLGPRGQIGQIPSGNAQQERNRVKDVAENRLQREGRFVDVEVAAPPREQAVDEADGGQDAEQGRDDGAANLDTQPRAVGKGVQRVLRLVLVVVRNDDPTRRQRLLRLGVPELGMDMMHDDTSASALRPRPM